MPPSEPKSNTPVCHIVSPAGNMGYGFNFAETETAIKSLASTGVPTAIIMDAGSTDGGPSKLALGFMNTLRSAYVRDLSKLLMLVDRYQAPLLFASAGRDGSDDHVKEMLGIIEEILARQEDVHYKFKTLALFSEINSELVLDRLAKNHIRGCGPVVPPLEKTDVLAVPRIVSQMGPEPYIDAMNETPDFDVIGDDHMTHHLSLRIWLGRPPPQSNILECGGHCATPKSMGASATMYIDGSFDVWPNDAGARCTRTSVSAHTLYEKTRPDILHGPGGFLDVSNATYEELADNKTVRVCGEIFKFSRDTGEPYTLKLEAAKTVGYRCMMLGSIKDPILISQIESLLETLVKPYVRSQAGHIQGCWDIDFNITGLGNRTKDGHQGEIFIVGESLAPTLESAREICALARMAICHGSYPGHKAISGNMAWGIGGRGDIDMGLCAQFCIYYLMDTEAGEERLSSPNSLFTCTVQIFGQGGRKRSIDDANGNDAQASPEKPRKRPAVGTDITKHEDPKTLVDIAKFLRSKNAGPYEVTFDVMFPSKASYDLVKEAGILNANVIAELMDLQPEQIVWSGFFDQAFAYKATIPRLRNGKVFPNGGYLENDVWAAQQYLPLLHMKLPESLRESWKTIC